MARQKRRSDAVKRMSKTYHYHLCSDCNAIYEDSCREPLVDSLCYECRGVERPEWMVHMLPYPCCTPENLEYIGMVQTFASYRLAGNGSWALCKTCQRKQVYRSK